MTFPTPGNFRPGPPPVPRPPMHAPSPQPSPQPAAGVSQAVDQQTGEIVRETGHPAVDAVLSALENASRLAPSEQIAEYEAAHQVLQETLASIDR